MDPRNPYSQSVGYTGLLYSQHESVNDGNSPYESFPSGSSQIPQFSSQHTKASDSSKRKTVESDSQTETTGVGEEEIRPEGVKAAKAKRNGSGKSVDYYTTVLELRKVDLDRKEKLQKLAILDTLLARTQPLSEAEEAAKNKLLAEYI
ncbi:hypothetical protein Bca52824_081650 [Brassica carinata]|uniref:No apical meristem-associated C-terminal domain-containing protein n=1 Tax=Brassica carinata TaxID=52824 RepID=A0A8X7PKX6_BRACI|nr:hypothetical protein Bca52824_081650 [Brassica carinata]